MMYYPIWNLLVKDPPISCPSPLLQIPEPPRQLFIQGTEGAMKILDRLPERGLAVVGTRSPQKRSLELIKRTIEKLRGSDLILVSGLARGIDTEVHSAALEFELPTIAVLGAGLEVAYPQENQVLRNRILASGGLLVSEFSHHAPPRAFHFLKRNRIIAGWSQATWVVEAAIRSGALNTARWAREQNRTCFAVPCYPGDPRFAGNQTLLDRDHALAFWDIHSLGAVWLDLATKRTTQPIPGTRPDSHPAHLDSDARLKKRGRGEEDCFSVRKIAERVKESTFHQGGIELQDLFNWAASQGWDPEHFFAILDQALQENLITHHHGELVSS